MPRSCGVLLRLLQVGGGIRWAVTLIEVLTVTFVACGGETHDPADATADATSEKQWPIVYNIVDGGGDDPECYYDGDIVHTCCNGQPCRGFCVLDDDGSVGCSCYGIPGGCTGDWESGEPANICCARLHACVATDCVNTKP